MESSDSTPVHPTLPQRSGPPPRTTGSVPHTQIDVDPVPEVHDELFRRTFALPDVENRADHRVATRRSRRLDKRWRIFSPNPPKDTDGRREDSGRGWVRELQGRWPGALG